MSQITYNDFVTCVDTLHSPNAQQGPIQLHDFPAGTRACLLTLAGYWAAGWSRVAYSYSLGRRVGSDRAVDAGGFSSGRSPVSGSSPGGRGDRVAVPDGLTLAGSAGRVRSLADGMEAASSVQRERHLGPDPRRDPRRRGLCRTDRLGAQRGLHDQPRPSARDEPPALHRGPCRMTKI